MLAQRNGAGGEPLCRGVELGTSDTARRAHGKARSGHHAAARGVVSVWRRAWAGGRRVATRGLRPRRGTLVESEAQSLELVR